MIKPRVKLYNHQEAAAQFALTNNGDCALYMEIGTGKTLAALTIFERLRKRQLDLRMLVICPISLIEAAWIEDIRKFTSFSYCNLRGKDLNPADIYLVNYEQLRTKRGLELVSCLTEPNPTLAVLDESSRIKSHSTKITKTLLKLKHSFRHRIVMSGTPAPNSEEEYWPQITFIRDGTFPSSFYAFRNYYFHLARGGQTLPSGSFLTKDVARNLFSKGFKYELSRDSRAQMIRQMAPCCFYVKKAECLDLPDQISEVRKFELPPDIRKVYDAMNKKLVAEVNGREVAATVALAKIVKLREICSGFLLDGDRALKAKSNPKLKELAAVVEEIGDAQAIIWCEFRQEIEDLKALLGHRAVTLYGATKDKHAPIRAFQAGESQFIIANSQSMAHGVTLTNCSVQIFYTLSYSFERHEQSRGRTHRIGQTNKCVYIYLIAKDSIEEIIMRVLRRKGKQQEIVEEYIRCQRSS